MTSSAAVSERVLRETSTWRSTVLGDRRGRSPPTGVLAPGDYLLDAMTKRLADGPKTNDRARAAKSRHAADAPTVLDRLDLSRSLGDKEYHKELESLQGRLNRLVRKAKKECRSTI